MGDREFIGAGWMRYLSENRIDFVVRLRENQLVARQGYAAWPLSRIAHALTPGQSMILKGMARLGGSPAVRIVIMRLKTGELLALACRSRPGRALALYRQRWTVETLFANLKTRGFDMEATHLANRKKLSTLIAILAIAITLAVKTGVAANAVKPVPTKSHGRPAVSLFSRGLAIIKKLFATPCDKDKQAIFGYIISKQTTLKPKLTAVLSRGV